MKVKKIIFAVDENPDYEGFWKVNSEICTKHLGVEPVLFRITDNESEFYRDEFGLVKNIRRVEGVNTGMQSQIYRMYGTKYFMDEVCMIGDIDLLIFDMNYIDRKLEPVDEDALAILCSDGYDSRRPECTGIFSGDGFRYPMAYITGKGKAFYGIIGNDVPFEDFAHRVNSLGLGNDSDEIYLASRIRENHGVKVQKLERGYSSNFYCPNRIEKHHFFRRDDFFEVNLYGFVNLNGFIDCHCPKPFSQYRDTIERIKNQLLSENVR